MRRDARIRRVFTYNGAELDKALDEVGKGLGGGGE